MSRVEQRLLTITAGALALIHLVQVVRFTEVSYAILVVLCYASIYLLLRKRTSLWSEVHASNWMSALLGLAFFAVALTNFALLTPENTVRIHLSAFVAAAGLALVAGGMRGPRVHWRELAILLSLSLPRLLFQRVFDVGPATASVSGWLLWYLGFDVQVSGIHIALPQGAVRVDEGCVGAGNATFVLTLAVIFVVLFERRLLESLLVLVAALAIGFFANALRVAALAILQSYGKQGSFDYWHQGTGAELWTVLPVTVLGFICLRLLKRRAAGAPATT